MNRYRFAALILSVSPVSCVLSEDIFINLNFDNDTIILSNGETRQVDVTISVQNSTNFQPFSLSGDAFCLENFVCHAVINQVIVSDLKTTFPIMLTGDYFGISDLTDWQLTSDTGMTVTVIMEKSMTVKVKREELSTALIMILIVFLGGFMSVNTFMMGTQVKVANVIEIFKRPIGPMIGLSCQFVMMPLLAYVLALTLLPSSQTYAQIALLTYGCSPGGGASNQFSLILDGNLDMSIAMTLVSNVFAIAAMPLWLTILGPTFYTENVKLPVPTVIGALLITLSPIIVGVVFGYKYPKRVRPLYQILRIVTLVAVFFMIPFAIHMGRHIFVYITWMMALIGLCFSGGGLLFSYCVAKICRQSSIYARTIAIETGAQNGLIASLVVMASLPEPENELANIVPAVTGMLLTPVLLMWVVTRAVRKKWFGLETPEECKRQQTDAEKEKRNDWIRRFFKWVCGCGQKRLISPTEKSDLKSVDTVQTIC